MPRRPHLRTIALIFAFSLAASRGLAQPSATAEGDPPQRPTARSAAGDDPARAWHDFRLASDDGAHELRFLGIVQGDVRLYPEPGDAADANTFLVRRARLYVEGHIFDAFEYRLMTDFGQGRIQLRDAFVTLHFVDWLQLRVGKFKQPFSYEQFMMEDLTLVVFERSMLDELAPAREVGAMVFGHDLLDGTFDYYLALANGGQRDADFDTLGQGFDGIGRLAVRPLGWLGGIARNFMIGVSATVGEQNGSADPTRFTTPLHTTFLTLASDARFDGLRWRVSPELVFCAGPLGIATQYAHMEERLATTGAPSPHVLAVDAFYGLMTVLLSGESRDDFSQFIDPRHPLDPITSQVGPGAWELIVRTSGLRVTGDAAPVLSTTTSSITSAYELTIGLNWYMSRRVWVQLDYERAFWSTQLQLVQGAPTLWAVDNGAARLTIQW